ncbi:hypothetical protein SFR_5521 [Streptomyces sp. FR-008]|nr:hypothetical protein SFR_5521 [Streptomyces sp. FR-008]
MQRPAGRGSRGVVRAGAPGRPRRGALPVLFGE